MLANFFSAISRPQKKSHLPTSGILACFLIANFFRPEQKGGSNELDLGAANMFVNVLARRTKKRELSPESTKSDKEELAKRVQTPDKLAL